MPSRARAVDAVVAGRVLVGGAPVMNAARLVAADEAIVILPAPNEYVSRGGYKLAAALDVFGLDVHGCNAVDVGSSTGGFTDCLLQRGAAHVVAIDVGTNQLAWSLRNDPRVTVMEQTNVRDLAAGALAPAPTVCVVDVSFISLRTVAPHLLAIAAPDAEFVLLIKPQFEAGRARLPRGGVVRDPAVHAAVLSEVITALDGLGLGVRALIPSPLRGAEGNVEFLAHARVGPVEVVDPLVAAAVEAS